MRFLTRHPRLEQALSALQGKWNVLPELDLRIIFEDFNKQEVRITELPMGPWSTPINDLVVLVKIAQCLRAQRILEVGSFHGYTAKMLAEHTSNETILTAIDLDPRHGLAYRNTDLEGKIRRRIGAVDKRVFESDGSGSFDLIFIDADHSFDAVKHDTEILLPLLSRDGIIAWHDYGNWGRLSGRNGVPRYLHELSKDLSLGWIPGTWLALHSPSWNPEGQFAQNYKLATKGSQSRNDPWCADSLR